MEEWWFDQSRSSAPTCSISISAPPAHCRASTGAVLRSRPQVERRSWPPRATPEGTKQHGVIDKNMLKDIKNKSFKTPKMKKNVILGKAGGNVAFLSGFNLAAPQIMELHCVESWEGTSMECMRIKKSKDTGQPFLDFMYQDSTLVHFWRFNPRSHHWWHIESIPMSQPGRGPRRT